MTDHKPMTDAEIERYKPNPFRGTPGKPMAIRDSNGGWCKYEDHAEAIRQRDEEIAKLKDRVIHACYERPILMAVCDHDDDKHQALLEHLRDAMKGDDKHQALLEHLRDAMKGDD